MCQWYQDAVVCYAYLVDVPAGHSLRVPGSYFSRSRWFTRGWTLQELIAPHTVVFLSGEWEPIGNKYDLAAVIELITGIEQEVLVGYKPLRAVSVAKRMSWASERTTTRVEDEAYSLMGIFDISMPTLYGEGRRAFHRLQEEILRRIPDQSIFAWGFYHQDPLSTIQIPLHLSPNPHVYNDSFLAPSPSYFRPSRDVEIDVIPPQELTTRLRLSGRTTPGSIILSSYGVHTQMPLICCDHIVASDAYSKSLSVYLVILACEVFNRHNPALRGMITAVCYADPPQWRDDNSELFLRGAQVYRNFTDNGANNARLIILPNDSDLATSTLIATAQVKGVYITADYLNVPHQIRRVARFRCLPPKPEFFALGRKSEGDLQMRGYSNYHDPTHSLYPTDHGVLVVTNHLGSSAIIRFGGDGSPFVPSYVTLERWLGGYPAVSILGDGHLDVPEVATVLLPPRSELCTQTSYGDTFFQVSFSSSKSNLPWKVSLDYDATFSMWILEISSPPSGSTR
ncbi:hypothetical protein C8T65DRAFT_747259 [Cerioporus squamosus]|nr:hypothetical protein C8T65DRAFT_747259 [Cerioporus squamosus]